MRNPVREANPLTLLRRAANRLPDPDDYLAGRSLPRGFELPFSVLCFCRKDARLLLRHSGLFHRDHHHRQVLLCALEGRGEICIDDRIEWLEPGAALLIAPYQFHHYLSFSPQKIAWLFITFELRSDFLTRPLRSSGPIRLAPDATTLMGQLLRAWQGGEENPQLPLLLGAFLCELQGGVRARSEKEVLSLPDSDLLSRINTLVLQKECFPIKELSSALGFSESHLRARFRTETGLSLGHHIRRLRIQKACSLLASSSMRIQEIAEACRFNSVYAFSRSFHVGAGVSPSQYRRTQRKYGQVYGADEVRES